MARIELRDEGFPTAQLRREHSLLAKAAVGLGVFGLIFFLSVIVQSFLGDQYLTNEGSLWAVAQQAWCEVAPWGSSCAPASSSTSTSPSLSTSTSAAN
ncbi:MAG TPA: hypothetical protein VHS56_08635 [Candidatus Cybelea sp.]|nr:hypothetical protein [Candidatus Cybelea sp.]